MTPPPRRSPTAKHSPSSGSARSPATPRSRRSSTASPPGRSTTRRPAGDRRRAGLRDALALMNYQFNAHGIELGYRYRAGAVVPDGSPEPLPVRDPQLYYQPTTWPGAHLPHGWLDGPDGRISTLDLVAGTRFSLITGIGGEGWSAAARRATEVTGVSVDVHYIGTRDGLRDNYGDWAQLREVQSTRAVLVRPDRHVAWRAEEYTSEAASSLCDVLQQILAKSSDPRHHTGAPVLQVSE